MDILSSLHEPVVLSLAPADIAAGDWPALFACLGPDEQTRAQAFHHSADRQSFICAHALLRLSLAARLGIPPTTLRFVANAYGKPALAPDQAADAEFNIAHSRGMVAVAVARGQPVGVDTEPLHRLAETDAAAIAHWLAPGERARLDACSEAARVASLIDLWVLKEAVIKAAGRGLSIDLASFAVDPDRLSVTGLDGDWRLARWTRDRHLVAVALLDGSRHAPRHCAVRIVNHEADLQVIAK